MSPSFAIMIARLLRGNASELLAAAPPFGYVVRAVQLNDS